MIVLVFILGLCGVAIWFLAFLLFCVSGIVLIITGIFTGIKKSKNGNSSAVSKSKKQRVPPVLYIIYGVILTAVSFVILPPIFDCFRGNGYDFLNKSLELLMKSFVLIGILFAVCFLAISVLLLVKGIQTARELKSINDDTRGKKSKLSVLLILLGAAGIFLCIMIFLSALNFGGSSDLEKYDKFTKISDVFSHFTPLLEYGIFVVCAFAVTVWFWVKGIRTARELKSIDDVDTYNKKLKSSVLLFFLGTAGIGVSIFSVWAFIHVLNNILIRIRHM